MIRKLSVFDFADDFFPLQEESQVRAMEYKSVKEKLFGITKDKHSKYNKFKDKDRYMTGKYTAIHGTAAASQKFKKLFPHYRHTESAVRVCVKIPSNCQVPIIIITRKKAYFVKNR